MADRCRVAGAAFTELVPALDMSGLSALVVVRLVSQLLGAMARATAVNMTVWQESVYPL